MKLQYIYRLLGFASILNLGCCLQVLDADSTLPAFPGAEGFGASAQGGRGGEVLFVTNLDDSGPGSLRDAINAQGPRTIVFRTSGVIELQRGLELKEPYCTIAGQTAPGDGVCLKNFGFTISTHDVIVRHLRFRPGDEPGTALRENGHRFEPDAVTVGSPSRDVILDHCSASWATDETLSVSGTSVDRVTIQWCFITESLNDGFHSKGEHGFGSLIRCNGHVSFHHNLFAHHQSRSPRPGTYGDGSVVFDFRNNVIYDTKGYSAEDPVRMNYVGNYIRRPKQWVFKVGGIGSKIYQSDNFLEGAGKRNADFWQFFDNGRPHNLKQQPFAVAEVATESAQDAFERVLASGGATLPRRDKVDARIVEQVRQGSGSVIDSQAEVGGWPDYRSTEPPLDTDNDGMPDAWEEEHGLDSTNSDPNSDSDGDGYTNLEEFLNGTDPRQAD